VQILLWGNARWRFRWSVAGGACSTFVWVGGCNGIAGIEEPIDKPAADATQTADARDAAGGSPNDREVDPMDRSEDGPSGPGADAAQPTCASSTQSFRDPNTGVVWTPVWYCGNRSGAIVFEQANATTPIGTMNTATSWFVCYRHGETHRGKNDVWYYTQGDEPLAGWESRQVWGYMPAVDVYTPVDPFPGIVECAANP
jgi:hypothetical protein